MLRYSNQLLDEYSDHVLLTGLLVVGGALLAVGFVLEAVRGADVWTGFLGVMAVLTITMSLLGYGVLFTMKGVLRYQKRRDLS